jgi:hypothetical protein
MKTTTQQTQQLTNILLVKSVAEFKRALKIGRKVNGQHHLTFAGRNQDGSPIWITKDLGTREVSIVQSNSFALKTQKHDGTYQDSWCSYPKATECVFNADGSLTILEEQRDGKKIPVLTYAIIND